MPKQSSSLSDNVKARYNRAVTQFQKKYPGIGERMNDEQVQDEFNVGPLQAKAIRTAINTRREIADERAKKEPEYKKLTSMMNKYASAVSRMNTP